MPNPKEKTASEEAALPTTLIDELKSYTPPANPPKMPTPASRKGFLRRKVKSHDDEDIDEETAELRRLEMRVEFLKKKRQLVAAIKKMEWKIETGDLESDDETTLNKNNSPKQSPKRWRSFDPRRWKKRSYSFDDLSSDDDLPLIRQFHNALECIDDGCGPIIMCANEFTDIDRQCMGCAKDVDESLYTEDPEIIDATPALPVQKVEMPADSTDDAIASNLVPDMTDEVKDEETVKKANGGFEKEGKINKVIEDSNGTQASRDDEKKEEKAKTIEDSDDYLAYNLVAPITMLAKTLSQNFSSTEITAKDLQANKKVTVTDENIQEGKNDDDQIDGSAQGAEKDSAVQDAGWMDKAASVFGSSFTQQMEDDVGLDYFARILPQPKIEAADEPSKEMDAKIAKVTVTPMSFSGLSITSKKKGDKSEDNLPPVRVVLSVLKNEESCSFVDVPGMRVVNDSSKNVAKKNYRKQHVMGVWDVAKGNDAASEESASFATMINLSTTEGDVEGNTTRTTDVKMSPYVVHLRVCIKRDDSEELLPIGVAKVLVNGGQRDIELTIPLRPEYYKSMNDLVKKRARPPESKWQAFKNFVLEDEEEILTYARFKGFKNETYRLEKDAFIRINLNVAPDATQLSSWFPFPLLNKSGLEPTSKYDASHKSSPLLGVSDVEPPTDNVKKVIKDEGVQKLFWFQKTKKVESNLVVQNGADSDEDIKCTKVGTSSGLFSSKPGTNDAVISKSVSPDSQSIVVGKSVLPENCDIAEQAKGTKDEPLKGDTAKVKTAKSSQKNGSRRAHEHFKEEAAKKKAAKEKAAEVKAKAAKEKSTKGIAVKEKTARSLPNKGSKRAHEHFKEEAAKKEAAKQVKAKAAKAAEEKAAKNEGKNLWFKKSEEAVTEKEGEGIQLEGNETANANTDSNLGKNLVGAAGIGASAVTYAPIVVDKSTTSKAAMDMNSDPLESADSKAAYDNTVQLGTKLVTEKTAKNLDYSANDSSSPTDDDDHISLFDDAGSTDQTVGDVKEDKLGESSAEQSKSTDAVDTGYRADGIVSDQNDVGSINDYVPAKLKKSWFKKSEDDKMSLNAPLAASAVVGGAVAMKALRSNPDQEETDEACQVENGADETTNEHQVDGRIELRDSVSITDDNNPGSTKKSGWFKMTRGKPSFDKSEKTSDTSSTGSSGVEQVAEIQVTSTDTETVPRKGKWSFKTLRSNKQHVSAGLALGAATGTPAAVASHASFEVLHHDGSKTSPTVIVEADDSQSLHFYSVEDMVETDTAPGFEEAKCLDEIDVTNDGNNFLLSDVDVVHGSDNEACGRDLSEHSNEDCMKRGTDQTDSPINYGECEGIEMELKYAHVCRAKSNMSIRKIPGILSRSKSKRAQ